MKKVTILTFLSMFLIIFSCKKEEGKSQLKQNEEVLSLVDQGGGGGGYLCPPGQCPHYSYQLDVVNFHKPRTDCTKKFGFCVQGHWSFTCERNGITILHFLIL
jgi:hypothetical protein